MLQQREATKGGLGWSHRTWQPLYSGFVSKADEILLGYMNEYPVIFNGSTKFSA